MDFQTRGFELLLELFVAPPRTKRPAQYSEWDGQGDGARAQIIASGCRVESVTIGRMPGRQVIVYDKRAEAIAKNKLHWFEQWGVDPRDPEIQVWRVEFRAGERHLKQDFGLSTFTNIEDSVGDVFSKMARDIR